MNLGGETPASLGPPIPAALTLADALDPLPPWPASNQDNRPSAMPATASAKRPRGFYSSAGYEVVRLDRSSCSSAALIRPATEGAALRP